MAWWEWTIMAVALCLPLVPAILWIVRRTARGRAILALSARDKLRFGRLLLAERDAPLPARVLVVLLIGYLALPFDLIPDFIPVAGHLDDILVLCAVVGFLLWLIPGERIDAALAAARRPTPRPQTSSRRVELASD